MSLDTYNSIINKNINKLNNENEISKKDEKEIINELTKINKTLVEKVDKLEKDYKKIKNQVIYNDANLKANYLVTILGTMFFAFSILFDFSQVLKIPNVLSTIIFISLITLFFYKENLIIVKTIFKKVFIKS